MISLIEPVFEEIYRNHPRNPFIGRTITITEYRGGEVEERQFWNLLYRFMKNFGRHIWYLTVLRFQHSSNFRETQKLLRFVTTDVFLFCPDLRSLRISGYIDNFPPDFATDLRGPPGAKLETLMVDNAYYDKCHPIVTSLLLRHHAQLGRLHVKAKTWKFINHFDWPSLVELHLEELETEDDFDGLSNSNLPQLKKVGLSLIPILKDWMFPKMLECINKISSKSSLHTL